MAEKDAQKGAQEPITDRLSPFRSRSIVDLVLRQLEGLFDANAFRPGERLNEVFLAQAMSVSRSSLREAARKLEQRGWLVSRPNRGFFVRSFTETEVTQIYEARFCLESLAVRKALPELTAHAQRKLERDFEALALAAEEKAENLIVDRILAFHRTIAGLAGNEILLASFNSLAMDTKLIISLIGGVRANPGEALRRNKPIYETLVARDVAASVAELECYLTVGRGEVVAFLHQDQQAGMFQVLLKL